MEDESDSDQSDEAQDAAAALAPFVGRGLAGAIDETTLRTTRDEAQSLALLEGASLTAEDGDDAAPTYLEDAFSQQGGEFVDESSEGGPSSGRRRRPSWASTPRAHFSPPYSCRLRRTRWEGGCCSARRAIPSARIWRGSWAILTSARPSSAIRDGSAWAAPSATAWTRKSRNGRLPGTEDAPQRGLADVCGRLLQDAPLRETQAPPEVLRLLPAAGRRESAPQPPLAVHRSKEICAADDAWATLAVYKKLEARGATFELHDVAAEAPSPDRQRGRPVARRADDLRAFVNRSLAGQTGTHTRFGDA